MVIPLQCGKRSTRRQSNSTYAILSTGQESTISDDPQSIKIHMKGLENELKKASPRDIILLPLMKSTFAVRRDAVVHGEKETFASILATYPALSRLAVVSLCCTPLTYYHLLFTLG